MSYASHEITALIQVAPNKAKAKLLGALRKTGMHKANASKAIGCTHGTLLRWIAKLGLQQEIEKMTERAKKEGWFINGRTGRPPNTAA